MGDDMRMLTIGASGSIGGGGGAVLVLVRWSSGGGWVGRTSASGGGVDDNAMTLGPCGVHSLPSDSGGGDVGSGSSFTLDASNPFFANLHPYQSDPPRPTPEAEKIPVL